MGRSCRATLQLYAMPAGLRKMHSIQGNAQGKNLINFFFFYSARVEGNLLDGNLNYGLSCFAMKS